MPEYLALTHFHHATAPGVDDEMAPPEIEEMERQFLEMERRGVARLN